MALATAGAFAARTAQDPPPVPALKGSIAALHHPIRTTKSEAQRLFDQGLMLYYGFNRDGARQSFERAAAIDPAAAMPHIGAALSLGPNLNVDATPEEIHAGCASARKAASLARLPAERAYAGALVGRYCGPRGLDAAAYVRALENIHEQHVADVDAAVLYAESLLLLRPRTDGQQQALIAVLESALRTAPAHVGANHYYIHAVEGSSKPERGLDAAKRLSAPVAASGHLLHMPSHIFMRLGEYGASVRSNVSASAVDLAYLRSHPPSDAVAMSYRHDLESLAVAAGFLGRFTQARQAGAEIARVDAGLAGKSSTFSPALAFVLLRFQRWDEVVRLPAMEPDDAPASMMLHFARAIAFKLLGDLPSAVASRASFEEAVRRLPKDAVYRGNAMATMVSLFETVLAARVAADKPTAIDNWKRAAGIQDSLVYHDPAPFYYPVRESLGAALFEAGRYAEAERVFRDDLARNSNSGRSLFGLWQTLAALQRGREIDSVREEFVRAWSSSDVKLEMGRY